MLDTNRLLDWVEKHYLRATLYILAVLVVLFGVAFCSLAQAADAAVSWTHPTQYTDGSALPLASIKETVVQYGTCVAAVAPATAVTFGTLKLETLVAAPDATVRLTGIVAATYCFRAATRDTQLRTSSWSSLVQKAVVEIKPKAPATVVVISP